MNIILFDPDDAIAPDEFIIRDARRLRHLHDVHQAQPQDLFSIGVLGGQLGKATLLSLEADHARLKVVTLDTPPPPALPVHLVLALPRPRMLARSLEHITALGVKEITLLHTRRVEKSYWQSPELNDAKIQQHLRLGLEQSKDSMLPKVNLCKGFRPFVEDQLPALLRNRRGLLAHPGMPNACPRDVEDDTLLLIGPEGGFIEWEVEKLIAAGCEGIHLGPRILRVETAVTALLARLF